MAAHDWPVTIDSVFRCWLWTGKTNDRGYPIVGWRGNAGKHVYETEVGPVPDGLELDHLCRVRRCVAPHHREPVTRGENEKRKLFRYRCRRKTCPRGHSMDLALMTSEGGRLCRTCHKQER